MYSWQLDAGTCDAMDVAPELLQNVGACSERCRSVMSNQPVLECSFQRLALRDFGLMLTCVVIVLFTLTH